MNREAVATVGFPNVGLQGFAPTLAKGEIASLAGAQDDARHFQISASIPPGNSGGALVDERGNVIGVLMAKLIQQSAPATSGTLAENVNYAVKSSCLLGFLHGGFAGALGAHGGGGKAGPRPALRIHRSGARPPVELTRAGRSGVVADRQAQNADGSPAFSSRLRHRRWSALSARWTAVRRTGAR